MAKAADAFRTISEVAEEIGIPKHVLRFWEVKFPQIRPMKRGGGRRFYRPEDLDLLKGICRLLHNEGYTIKGVQKILRRDGVEAVKAVTPPEATSPKETANTQSKVPPSLARRKSAQQGASPLAARGRGAKQPARAHAPLPPDLRQAITSVLDELASLKAYLSDSNSTSQPARLRGAA